MFLSLPLFTAVVVVVDVVDVVSVVVVVVVGVSALVMQIVLLNFSVFLQFRNPFLCGFQMRISPRLQWSLSRLRSDKL